MSVAIPPSIKVAYASPGRHYHTIRHIEAMLEMWAARFNDFPPLSHLSLQALEWAILYHDAVYDPYATDNEERSALLALKELNGVCTVPVIQLVRSLILSTKTHMPGLVSEKILSDLDLAILGSGPDRYQNYAVQIRAEYEKVPREMWRIKRSEVMRGFLDREQIFFYLVDLEEPARANIEQELKILDAASLGEGWEFDDGG